MDHQQATVSSSARPEPLPQALAQALARIFGIGMGQAATALSALVNEGVALNILDLQLTTDQQLSEQLSEQLGDLGRQRLCRVVQPFDGYFAGEARLLFPEENSLEIVRRLTGKNLPLPQIIDLEQEALAEVGNIILNAGIAALSDAFRRDFSGSLPLLRQGNGAAALGGGRLVGSEPQLAVWLRFTFAQNLTEGDLLLVLDAPRLAGLRRGLEHFLRLMPGQPS